MLICKKLFIQVYGKSIQSMGQKISHWMSVFIINLEPSKSKYNR